MFTLETTTKRAENAPQEEKFLGAQSAPEVINQTVLDFTTTKVRPITLAQLEASAKEHKAYSDEPLMGIYHYVLINQALDMCKEQGFDAEVYDLFAAQNRDKQVPGVSVVHELEKKYGRNAVQAHILRRVYANIRIKDFDNEENTTNLAIAFHQKGIQVGFGRNVMVCHNQCMLNASQYAATYSDRGNDRMPLQSVLDSLKSWLVDARHIIETQDEKIEQMKNFRIPAEEMFRIIGMLTAIRVMNDTRDKRIYQPDRYPLNQSQISTLTEKMIVAYKEKGKVTAWDLYNGATDLYYPGLTDVPNIITQNLAMSKFIDENVMVAK